jgi:hypothetical protein
VGVRVRVRISGGLCVYVFMCVCVGVCVRVYVRVISVVYPLLNTLCFLPTAS